jgi:Thymidylate kinase
MPSHRIRTIEAFRKTHESHNHEERTAIDALSMTVLVSGDRLITLNEEVIPALKRGEWVLCDRYTYTGNICCSDPIIQSISERFIQPDLAILAAADLMIVKNRVLSRPTEKHLFFDDHEVQQIHAIGAKITLLSSTPPKSKQPSTRYYLPSYQN